MFELDIFRLACSARHAMLARHLNFQGFLILFSGISYTFWGCGGEHKTVDQTARMRRLLSLSSFTYDGAHVDHVMTKSVVSLQVQLISAFVVDYLDSKTPLFKPLAIVCGCTARLVSNLVRNPEDRLSSGAAHATPLT